MASDYLLEIEGIKGESKDAKRPGTIEIESFSWGLRQTGARSAASGSGGGAGKVSFSDLHFTAKTSIASPLLMLACATGEHIKQAVLYGRKRSADATEYLKIKLTDILISSFQGSGGHKEWLKLADGSVIPPADTEIPVEAFHLNFAKIEFDYQDSVGGGSHMGWDVKANTKI